MATSYHPDPIVALAAAIRETSRHTADAYLLAGVLIEGVTHVITEGIAAEHWAECGLAAVQLMVNRLRTLRVI
jgi:hypothetical protein